MANFLTILDHIGHQALVTLLIVAVALLVSALSKRLIRRSLRAEHLPPVMAGRLQTLRRWVVFILALVALLKAFDVFGSAWALISAALAAVAVGFVAAWSVLSNLTSALLLLTFRPFRMGDHVDVVDSGSAAPLGGRVVDMNLMFTTLRVESPNLPEGSQTQYLRVPNNMFFQKMIRTYTSAGPINKDPFFRTPERGRTAVASSLAHATQSDMSADPLGRDCRN